MKQKHYYWGGIFYIIWVTVLSAVSVWLNKPIVQGWEQPILIFMLVGFPFVLGILSNKGKDDVQK